MFSRLFILQQHDDVPSNRLVGLVGRFHSPSAGMS